MALMWKYYSEGEKREPLIYKRNQCEEEEEGRGMCDFEGFTLQTSLSFQRQ